MLLLVHFDVFSTYSFYTIPQNVAYAIRYSPLQTMFEDSCSTRFVQPRSSLLRQFGFSFFSNLTSHIQLENIHTSLCQCLCPYFMSIYLDTAFGIFVHIKRYLLYYIVTCQAPLHHYRENCDKVCCCCCMWRGYCSVASKRCIA